MAAGSKQRAKKIESRLDRYAKKHGYKKGSAKYNTYVHGTMAGIAMRKRGIKKGRGKR